MAGILSDELNKEMDADLFGGDKKSSLDPKLSEQMDKDLGLAPSRPWAGAIKPPEPALRKVIRHLGSPGRYVRYLHSIMHGANR